MGYVNGDEKAAYLNGDQNQDEDKQSFSIWPGLIFFVFRLIPF